MTELSKSRTYLKNLISEKEIRRSWHNKNKRYVYNVDGMIFDDLKEALVESMPYGNARREGILAMHHDPEIESRVWFLVYDANGMQLLKTEDKNAAALRLAHYTNTKKPLNDEQFEHRKRHYIARHRARLEAARRRMIEEEKAKLLEERERERQRLLDLKRVGDVQGSW